MPHRQYPPALKTFLAKLKKANARIKPSTTPYTGPLATSLIKELPFAETIEFERDMPEAYEPLQKLTN